MNSPTTIRPYEEADHPAVLGIYSRTLPPGVSEPLDGEAEERRFVTIDSGGQVVGYIAATPRLEGPFTVLVDPNHQRRGIGLSLWARMEQEFVEAEIEELESWVREENLPARGWLLKQGFTQIKLNGPVCLYVQDVDLKQLEAEPLADGIVITTLAQELSQDPNCLAKLFELSTLVKRDVPGHGEDETWEAFLKEQNQPEAMPDAYFIAKDGDRYVGLSYLRPRESAKNLDEPGIIQQCLTGVLPEYRRRGIAMQLKLKTIVYSRDHNFIRLYTNSDNPAMQALNQKLKFISGPWLVFHKQLSK